MVDIPDSDPYTDVVGIPDSDPFTDVVGIPASDPYTDVNMPFARDHTPTEGML